MTSTIKVSRFNCLSQKCLFAAYATCDEDCGVILLMHDKLTFMFGVMSDNFDITFSTV